MLALPAADGERAARRHARLSLVRSPRRRPSSRSPRDARRHGRGPAAGRRAAARRHVRVRDRIRGLLIVDAPDASFSASIDAGPAGQSRARGAARSRGRLVARAAERRQPGRRVAAFSIFDERLASSANGARWSSHGGTLYVRGYKGLFAARSRLLDALRHFHRELRLRRSPPVAPPVWSFVVADSRLLVSAGRHPRVRGTTTRLVTLLVDADDDLSLTARPGRVYVGLARASPRCG